MLCYAVPGAHRGSPSPEELKSGLIAYKIAAHAADVAKGHPEAQQRDDALSLARSELRGDDRRALSLDPDGVHRCHDMHRTAADGRDGHPGHLLTD
jgi:phosphomethylpyrimidine synthase